MLKYLWLTLWGILLISCSDNHTVPDFIEIGHSYTALIEEGQPPQRFKVMIIDRKKGWVRVEGVYGNSYWLDITQVKTLKDTGKQ